MAQTYYFTYGLGQDTNQAYQGGGWTEVLADDRRQAVELYKAFHPLVNGLLPCCGVAYTHAQMAEVKPWGCMLTDGNGGKFCRDRIRATREVL